MSARKTPRAARGSSFLNTYSDHRLNEVFSKVRRFVSLKFPHLHKTELRLDCPEIMKFRKENPGYLGDRAFMHAGHHRDEICSIRWAAGLADTTLVAMMLHEFGHGGGRVKEPAANEWVRKNFGIEIVYKGPLDLQWIEPRVSRRVMAAYSSSP